MSDTSSISQWIAGLKTGEAEAAQRLWRRYSERLIQLARRRLGNAPRRVADEEDVAQSVFFAICRGADAGRLNDVKDRDELWWLLLRVTQMKVADYVRRESAQKRGAGRVRLESDLGANQQQFSQFSLDDLIGNDVTPEVTAVMEEEHDRLLSLLRDEPLRRIANARIEGYTVAEIADQLSVTTRTVERKLKLIRNRWGEELGNVQ
ncbi:MAG: ECF-type sigma factor [Pirellulales bacterium]|nr:ECF-type sigma factor [Pirellulales bacterium]